MSNRSRCDSCEAELSPHEKTKECDSCLGEICSNCERSCSDEYCVNKICEACEEDCSHCLDHRAEDYDYYDRII